MKIIIESGCSKHVQRVDSPEIMLRAFALHGGAWGKTCMISCGDSKEDEV